ncbi:thiolase family protein [Nocardioides ginsengisoli]|uniref:Thiolase family protein n=1 Tax=Nocardioides ginsengisoli TaxID=363868 RepID=A0ABW3VUP8_9ACTN
MGSRQGTCITGIGETPPARRSDKSVRRLVVDAALAAIADAGLRPGDIDGIVSDSVIMSGSVPRDWLSAQLGITRTFDASLSYGGAGSVGAPQLARAGLEAGLCTNVLVYFGVDWGTRPSGPYGFHDMYPAKRVYEKPIGFDAQPEYFALLAERYSHEYGLAEEELGAFAVNQREYAVRAGVGQKTKPLSMQEYLDTPMISDPLRFEDCCLISDGAVAYVLTLEERAVDAPHKPIHVRGVGFGSEATSGDDVFTQRADYLGFPGTAAARAAVEGDAGMSLAEADFAEIYDCFTISCLLQLEDLGICERGTAGKFALAGETRIDGRMPVNTHGGLLAHSYLLGAEHVIEAVRQLRGDAGPNQVADAGVGLVTGLSVPDYALLLLSNN